MIGAVPSENERQRLEALIKLDILDSPPEEEFDAIVAAIASVCNVPIALISLVDADRQWFKANVGLAGVTQTERCNAFCAHTILQDEILEIKNASKDPRFSDNPLVLNEPGIRFYAGAPIILSSGYKVGTLCVIDRKPRSLTHHQKDILSSLAQAVVGLIENRAVLRHVSKKALLTSEGAAFLLNSIDAVVSVRLDGTIKYWNPAAFGMFGYSSEFAEGKNISEIIPETNANADQQCLDNIALKQQGHRYTSTRVDRYGREFPVDVSVLPYYDDNAEIEGYIKVFKDISQETSLVEHQQQLIDQISEKEKHFRALSEASPLGVFSADSQGAVNYTNSRWQEIFELSDEESLGLSWLNRLHVTGSARCVDAWQQGIQSKQAFDLQFMLVLSTGETRYVHIRIKPVSGEVGADASFIGTVEDITQRISVYEQLKNSEAMLRKLYQSTPAMLQSLDEHGRLITVSDLWLERHGYTRDEVLGRYAHEFMTPESAKYAQHVVIPEFIKTGSVTDVHYQKVSKSGEVFDVMLSSTMQRDASGRFAKAICVLRDVTAELAAKRAANELLDSIQAQFIVSVCDDRGTIREVNDSFCALTQYSQEALIGQHYRIFNAGNHSLSFFKHMWRTVRAGKSWQGEVLCQSRDGQQYWLETMISPVKNSVGVVEKYICIQKDVTKRKDDEIAVIEQQQQIQQLIENQSVASFMIDNKHRVIHWNKACEILTGVKKDQIIGKHAWRGFYDHARPCLADLVLDNKQAQAKELYTLSGESALMDSSLHAEAWFTNLGDKKRYLTIDASLILDSNHHVTAVIETLQDITEVKEITEKVQYNERLLKRTGEVGGVGGWELDLINQRIRWTAQTCVIHGVSIDYEPTLEEAINFYTPESRPVIQAVVNEAITKGKPFNVELQMQQLNGQIIWIHSVGSAEYQDGKVVRVYGAIRDITEDVTQREAVKESELRFNLATNSGKIGVWDWNTQTDVLVWDSRMFELYGIAEDTPVNYALWRNAVHPDDLERTENMLLAAKNGSGVYDTEFRVIWPDASIHYIRATAQLKRNDAGVVTNLIGANWDVTRMHQLTTDLAQRNESMRVTMNAIADAVITTDESGKITWLNPVAEKLTGWLSHEVISRKIEQVFITLHEQQETQLHNPVKQCLQTLEVQTLLNENVLMVSREGRKIGIEYSVSPIINDENQLLGSVLVFRDVTERRKILKEINYKATHDQLTGLINRSEFESRLTRLLKKSQQDKSLHTIMFIDLDQFKLVNDACGHVAGDQLLISVSKMLKDIVRDRDGLARLGGDEFAVILENCMPEQSNRIAQMICDTVGDYHFVHQSKRYRIGASVGIAPLDSRWNTISQALQAADACCYAAKEAGRNRVHTWVETDQKILQRQTEMRWASSIENALENNHFVLFAQQIFLNDANKKGLHAEVLLRLRTEDGELCGPGAFIPAGERYHLASRIDKWVITKTLAWLSTVDQPSEIAMISINLSGLSVGDHVFHQEVYDLLSHTAPATRAKLCFEITETAVVSNIADASKFIDQLHELGVTVALDDFGAGASSFGYLKSLNIDILKIDGQFIKSMIEEPLDDLAVKCFVDIAKVLNLSTVAEFVENKQVYARVKALGITYSQGYHLHRPMHIVSLMDTDAKTPLH